MKNRRIQSSDEGFPRDSFDRRNQLWRLHVFSAVLLLPPEPPARAPRAKTDITTAAA